jgi:hypothetical protein
MNTDVPGSPEPEAAPGGESRALQPDILDVLNALPGGTRSKEEIDQQLAAERAAWDEVERARQSLG